MTQPVSDGTSRAPRLYTLTKYTRDGSRNRQTVIQGFEVPLRKLLLTLLGLAVSLIPTVFAVVLVGYWGMLLPVVSVAGTLWLVEHRTRDGLRVPMWMAIRHRRQEPVNRFLCSGRPVDPLATGYSRVIASSKRVYWSEPDPAALFSPAVFSLLPPDAGDLRDDPGTEVEDRHSGRVWRWPRWRPGPAMRRLPRPGAPRPFPEFD